MLDRTAALSPLEAYQSLLRFARQRGENALRLALHAAVPQSFRAELLHLLRLNFLPEAANDPAVEADVLLAPFCEDIGGGYFQFDPEVRQLLLENLDPSYAGNADSQLRRVARFLLYFIDQQAHSLKDGQNRLTQDYLEVQRWVALAFLNPGAAAEQLAAVLQQASAPGAVAARVRVSGLASTLVVPLVGYPQLLACLAGFEALETGRLQQDPALLEQLPDEDITVGKVTLRSPWRLLHQLLIPAETAAAAMTTKDQAAGKTAFVSGFDHDIFVSYAHVDNQPLPIPGGVLAGWVDTLVENLRRLLSQKLGRKDWGNVWIDHRRLVGNEPLTPDIQQAVSRSATLVVILSEGYLQSDWCRQERELFLQTAQRSGGVPGRLFVVQLTDIERSRWPAPFTDLLGYKFFLMDDRTGRPRTLKLNADDPKDRCYSQRMDDLSLDLADRLKAMRTEPPEPMATFLAETTPDLEDLRDDIKRQLERAGLWVLPTTYYPRSPDDFAAAMQADLQDCMLFVQLLGPYTTRKTADLPRGYEGLQLDLAKEANKTIMRWRDPALKTDPSKNPELQSDDIMVKAFGDFKRDVETRARSLAAKQQLDSRRDESTYIPGDALALVNAMQIDQAVADEVCQALSEHNIGYWRNFDEKYPLADLAKEDIELYDALIFVYGQCEQSWVNAQLKTCRRITLRRKEKAPVCALYISPPSDNKSLAMRLPKFHYFNDLHGPLFHQFIAEIQAQVASTLPTLVEKGVKLAKQGKITEAVTAFSQARQYDPSLAFDPEAKAKQLAAPTLVEKGVELAKQGKINEALAAFSQVHEYDPGLEITADNWNYLCWFGSLWGQADAVMHACERAVVLSPDGGGMRDSRGIARALTGNLASASEDFRVYLEWAPTHNQSETRIAERQHWLRELEAGRNPFDAETLEALRKDEL